MNDQIRSMRFDTDEELLCLINERVEKYFKKPSCDAFLFIDETIIRFDKLIQYYHRIGDTAFANTIARNKSKLNHIKSKLVQAILSMYLFKVETSIIIGQISGLFFRNMEDRSSVSEIFVFTSTNHFETKKLSKCQRIKIKS